MMLSDRQFERARALASRLAGIRLVERHRELLERRSRRRGIEDDAALDSLLDAAESGQASARAQLLGLVTTKFTGFFRHPRHFQIAADHARQVAGRGKRVRLWSAGAATGEEPYSLAMSLLQAFGSDHPPVKILATDIDADALEFAGRGEFGGPALESVNPRQRERFFVGSKIAPRVRELVEFQEVNLAATDWPVEGPFDVILCRNVLMYLEPDRRRAALHRMALLLAPDGLLMLDPAEHPADAENLFSSGSDGVFSRCRREATR